MKSINKLKFLSLAKFVDLKINNDKEEEKQLETNTLNTNSLDKVEIYKKIMNQSYEFLKTEKDNKKNQDFSDSSSKFSGSTNTWKNKKGLPYIFGSNDFNKFPDCGIVDNPEFFEEHEIIPQVEEGENGDLIPKSSNSNKNESKQTEVVEPRYSTSSDLLPPPDSCLNVDVNPPPSNNNKTEVSNRVTTSSILEPPPDDDDLLPPPDDDIPPKPVKPKVKKVEKPIQKTTFVPKPPVLSFQEQILLRLKKTKEPESVANENNQESEANKQEIESKNEEKKESNDINNGVPKLPDVDDFYDDIDEKLNKFNDSASLRQSNKKMLNNDESNNKEEKGSTNNNMKLKMNNIFKSLETNDGIPDNEEIVEEKIEKPKKKLNKNLFGDEDEEEGNKLENDNQNCDLDTKSEVKEIKKNETVHVTTDIKSERKKPKKAKFLFDDD